MEGVRPLHDGSLDALHQRLHLLDGRLVAGDRQDGHAEVSGHGRVPGALADRRAVQLHVGEVRAREAVGAHARGFVVLVWYPTKTTPSKLPSIPSIMPWGRGRRARAARPAGSLSGSRFWMLPWESATTNSRRPRLARGRDRRVGLLASSARGNGVLEALRPELLARDDAADALHVDRDEDASCRRARAPAARRGARATNAAAAGGKRHQSGTPGLRAAPHYVSAAGAAVSRALNPPSPVCLRSRAP